MVLLVRNYGIHELKHALSIQCLGRYRQLHWHGIILNIHLIHFHIATWEVLKRKILLRAGASAHIKR